MAHCPLPFVWRVPKLADLTVFDVTAPMTVPEAVDYELRTISGWMPDQYDTEVWQVFAARGSIAEELRDALAVASRAGWEPWESSTVRAWERS